MKLEEMADVLDGLATTLEKCLGKTALSDFHALSACLRQFPGESVASFSKFTIQARERKSTAPRGAAGVNESKVQDLVGRIKHFLDHRNGYDYAAIRQVVAGASDPRVYRHAGSKGHSYQRVQGSPPSR